MGFGLAAFFWLPALIEGKYTLRDIVTASDYTSRLVAWKDFFIGQWSYGGTDTLSKQVGLVQWVGIVAGIVALFISGKKEANKKILLGIFLLVLLISLFMMTPGALFIWQHVSLLTKFQFPWRFLSVSVFAAAAIGGFAITIIPKKKHPIVLAIIIAMLLILNKEHWHAKAFLIRPEQFYTGIYNGTTDTGESSPVWSVRFMEKRPAAHLELIDGHTTIKEQERTSVTHRYTVTAETRSLMQENTLYFPGWKVFIDGHETPVEYQNMNYRGVMTFFVPAGEHSVLVQFSDTKLRLISNIVSLGCLCVLIGLLLMRRFKVFLKSR